MTETVIEGKIFRLPAFGATAELYKDLVNAKVQTRTDVFYADVRDLQNTITALQMMITELKTRPSLWCDT